jgi:hypothetical protein
MRPFVTFDAEAPAWRVHDGAAARLGRDAAVLWLALMPGFAFLRQRSSFILGWEAAAAAGAALADGDAAGAVGTAHVPALGSWMMLPDLTSPATATVLPMNDALYGASHVELDRQGPMVVHVPADPDGRYYSVGILDAHWSNVAHLGPKWTGRGDVDALLVPPGWTGEVPEGMQVVEPPTPSVCLLNRILVDYAPGDIDRARAWRAGFTLRPLHGELVDVPHDDLIHPEITAMDDPWDYLRMCLAHVARNPLPPENAWALELADVDAVLAAEHDDEQRQAVLDGVEDAQAMIDATLTDWPRVDGWRIPYPWIGLPTSHLTENAALQLFQVGSNDLGEAAYYFADRDADGAPLDGSGGAVHEVRFAADALPPVDDGGFWSLTMYGPDNLLVSNAIGRYSTRATRPGFVPDADGAVAITLAASLPDGVPDPSWLPAPDGPFRLGLRVYYPGEAARSGAWSPPAVRRVRHGAAT